MESKNNLPSGMTAEQMKSVFFNADALREPPYKLYRLDAAGYRYYYNFDESGQAVFFPSVTTLLRKVMPTSPFLIQWMVQNGESAEEKRDLAAAYGTLMHIQFESLLISGEYDFDKVPEIVQKYIESEFLPEKVYDEWVGKIRKDVLSMAQFIRDYNVRPLAVEIGLAHPGYRYAGAVDLACVMTDPKTKQDFTGIVDFKSGRKGFWEEHELQLHLYLMAWNQNFPETPVERVFNFAPKDWRSKPTYTLKEQTDAESKEKLPHLLALAAIEDAKRTNVVTLITGKLTKEMDPVSCVQEVKLSDLVKKAVFKADNEPESDEPRDLSEFDFTPENGDFLEK